MLYVIASLLLLDTEKKFSFNYYNIEKGEGGV